MPLITIKVERRTQLASNPRRRRARRIGVAVLVGTCAAAGLLLNTSASASVVSITAHTVQNNTVIAAHKTLSPVMIGAATTVPTDATRVRFDLTVAKAQQAGSLAVYPAGNPGGMSNSALPFVVNTATSATFTESIGLSNKITFENQSTGSISLTVKITGYSTEVHATDITGTGGSAGQVLTNTGAGASWQAAPTSRAYTHNSSTFGLTIPGEEVNSLAVPAGTYVVIVNALVTSGGLSNDVICELLSPGSGPVNSSLVSVNGQARDETITLQGVMTTTGGTITVRCATELPATGINLEESRITAVSVGTASGDVTPHARTVTRRR